MPSLPVEPDNPKAGDLFPGASAIFRFTTHYELLDQEDSIEKGVGYWIYVPEARTYTIKGNAFEGYMVPEAPSGWSMIGGGTYPAKATIESGTIRTIFGFTDKYK